MEVVVLQVLLVWFLLPSSGHHFPAFICAQALHSGKLLCCCCPFSFLHLKNKNTNHGFEDITEPQNEKVVVNKKTHLYSTPYPLLLLLTVDLKLPPNQHNFFVPRGDIRSAKVSLTRDTSCLFQYLFIFTFNRLCSNKSVVSLFKTCKNAGRRREDTQDPIRA